MIVAATAVVASIRRRQRDFLADPRSVLDCPVLADTTDPVVAALVAAYDEAVETLGECTPRHRGVPRGPCAPLMQRNTLCRLQISAPTGRPDAASTRTCTHPWMCVGWTSLRKLAPVWDSPRTPGQRRRRRGTDTARHSSPRTGYRGT